MFKHMYVHLVQMPVAVYICPCKVIRKVALIFGVWERSVAICQLTTLS